ASRSPYFLMRPLASMTVSGMRSPPEKPNSSFTDSDSTRSPGSPQTVTSICRGGPFPRQNAWRLPATRLTRWLRCRPDTPPASRHTEVAPQRDREPSGHGVALDRRDDRLAQDHPGWPHRAGSRLTHRISRSGGHRFQVKPGAESSRRASEHRDGQFVVRIEIAEGGFQRSRGFRVHRVAYLRTVDGDGEHRPIDLSPD